ncbi:MAG: glutaredoxin family protein [Flavobacteriales bacterium]|nr:glutaredoxin family protein [Flavobacteriales bacterium]
MMKKITVYSTSWCADCIRAKDFLDHHEVEYESINIELDESAAQKVMKLNVGKRIVPTIIVDGIAYSNPSLQQLADLIEEDLMKRAS